MSQSVLYDEDILEWSERQAALLRDLRSRADLPNELDLENVAEEIESLGRSELADVKSRIENILAHAIKLLSSRGSLAAAHWRVEIVLFQGALVNAYAPSMRQRIDLDKHWRRAVRQARVALQAHGEKIAKIPDACPLTLDDLLAEDIEGEDLALKIVQAAGHDRRS